MKNHKRMFNPTRQNHFHQNDSDLLTAEVDFTIKIKNPEFEFWQYREILYNTTYDKMGYHKSKEGNLKQQKSPFELFVREKLKRITTNERIQIVVTDYTESEGSFIITFSFFVFTTFMNYGQFRESMDYLRKDFDFFLRGVYPDNTIIMIDYNNRPNYLLENFKDGLIQQTYKIVNNELRKIKLFALFIGIFAISLSSYAIYKLEIESTVPINDNATIRAIIRFEIEKTNAEKTNEKLLQLLQQKKLDSAKK